jgi:hypothetical protein
VEALIVSSLMAFVGGVVVAAVTGGFSVWRRAADYGVGEEAALIAFEGFRRDLHSSRRFSPIPVEGDGEAFAVPAVGRLAGDPEGPEEIGRLGYFLDERQRLLCRSFVPYRLSRRYDVRDRCQAVLEDVERLHFEYFGMSEAGEMSWRNAWEAPGPPLAVKIAVVLHPKGKKPASYSTVAHISRTLKHNEEPE